MWFKQDNVNVLSLPGVPFEMKGLFDKFIESVKQEFNIGNFYHNTLLIAGIGESFFAEEIKDWEAKNRADNISVAYLPTIGILKLRLTGTMKQKPTIDDRIREIETRFPKYVVGPDSSSLEKRIGELLLEREASLGTIESCTGGGLANRIVSVPGSSSYFEGAIISYSNSIKANVVGVSEDTLDQYGAVSEATVIEMAEHGQQKLNVDYCISTSGIAGPSGGTEEKPVGLVWVAVATPTTTVTKQFNFGYNRSRNIESTIVAALNFLRITILA